MLQRAGRPLIEGLEHRRMLASTTFSNSGSIQIDDSFSPPTRASKYPSMITVSGISGSVTDISVQLNQFSHDSPADVDMLLVAPSGASIVLMSDAGLNYTVSNLTLTFDDSGGSLPDHSQINSRTYRPTNIDDLSNDDFPNAPNGGLPSGTYLWDLNSGSLNGTWKLYILDDQMINAGSIAGGWSITITTASGVPAPPSTPDLASTSDSGVSNTDNITYITTPTFTGTAEPGSTVRLYSGITQIGSGVATSGGAYSIVVVSDLSDGSRDITATATNSYGSSSVSGALALTIDTIVPDVGAGVFSYLTGQSLRFGFSENVSATLDARDLSLHQVAQSADVGSSLISVSYDSSTNIATFTWPGLPNATLADGNWGALIRAGGSVTDVAGNGLFAGGNIGFAVLAGDANHDHTVNVSDLGVLATNWQGGGKNFAQGDFNYDSVVDVTDLGILATNWQKTLTPPPRAPVVTAAFRGATVFGGASTLAKHHDRPDPLAASVLV